ncbi:hypothetical protein BLOT_015880 [Blomia tropicalis]|nr:hypothetical protein BLOT_015880 [Blomia tropicalis]
MKFLVYLLLIISIVNAELTIQGLIEHAEILSNKAYEFIYSEVVRDQTQFLEVINRDYRAILAIIDDLKHNEKAGIKLTTKEMDDIEIALKQYDIKIQEDIEEALENIRNLSTTLEPTTLEPTTPEPTTLEPTTPEPTTPEPTTPEPTTPEPTTQSITTFVPTHDPIELYKTAVIMIYKAKEYLKENENDPNAEMIKKVIHDIEQILDKLDKHPNDGSGVYLVMELGLEIGKLEELIGILQVTSTETPQTPYPIDEDSETKEADIRLAKELIERANITLQTYNGPERVQIELELQKIKEILIHLEQEDSHSTLSLAIHSSQLMHLLDLVDNQ